MSKLTKEQHDELIIKAAGEILAGKIEKQAETEKSAGLVLGVPGTVAAAAGAGTALKKLTKKQTTVPQPQQPPIQQPTQQEIVNKAAELLVEAIMQKQAAQEEYTKSEIVAAAAETALNKLGYSMYDDDEDSGAEETEA